MVQPSRSRAAPLATLQGRHGATFPTFWQDLVKWDGWKDVRREYLLFTENGGKFSERSSGGNGGVQQQQPRRKRRKRWASAADDGDVDAGAGSSRGRSRWARSDDSAPPAAPPPPVADPVMAALGLSAPIATPPSGSGGAPGLAGGLPGLAAGVSES